MPRKKKVAKKVAKTTKKKTTKKAEKPEEAASVAETPKAEAEPVREISYVPAVEKRILPVEIFGDILVAKPVPYAVAVLLGPYSPVPPRKGGEWSNKEKRDNKARVRKEWKLGKTGHYRISLAQLKMSDSPGYGIPSAAVMRAIQAANEIIPGHRVYGKLLNSGIEIRAQDAVNGLLRVRAKRGPFMKEDVVRVGHKKENGFKGTPSLTVRPAWLEWKIKLEVIFTKNLLDGVQVYNLLMWAGQCGLLEGRPSKGSALNWGRFDVRCGDERLYKIE